MGRAARNIASEVIMYADRRTKSMEAAIGEVERRREIQLAYNEKHGITPTNIEKAIRDRLTQEVEKKEEKKLSIDILIQMGKKEVLLPDEKEDLIKKLRKEMKDAASKLDFETATLIRDEIRAVEGK
jgi:excinuclease ABC subunit B